MEEALVGAGEDMSAIDRKAVGKLANHSARLSNVRLDRLT